MSSLIIPTIGSRGFYNLKAPFAALMVDTTPYTCQAIRRLGDYIAFNEDPLNNIYLPYGLTETDFQADLDENMYIVSLQSEQGQWLYVPASYLLSYPLQNGVPYQTYMIGVNLGAIPTSMDLTAIQTLISNLVYENLGIKPKMSPVSLSKPILVSSSDSEKIEQARLIRATQKMSDYGRYHQAQVQLQQALEKIQILEAWIKQNHPPIIVPGGP